MCIIGAAGAQLGHWRSCFSQIYRRGVEACWRDQGLKCGRQELGTVQSWFKSVNDGLLCCSLTSPVARGASPTPTADFACAHHHLSAGELHFFSVWMFFTTILFFGMTCCSCRLSYLTQTPKLVCLTLCGEALQDLSVRIWMFSNSFFY